MAGPVDPLLISPLLIRNCEVHGIGLSDVLIENGIIAQLGRNIYTDLTTRALEANGGALLPGLHDHHIHLAGEAVRGQSIWCGPPQVISPDTLKAALSVAATGWIRAIGYHESVLGMLPSAKELDAFVSDRALRMQHRSGRMWLLNSRALEELLALGDPPPGLEREGANFTGRLFDEDDWLRHTLGSAPPNFSALSVRLASYGVTGITDMSPHNNVEMARHFSAEKQCGNLVQKCVLAGTLDLTAALPDGWSLGPVKLHLHEAHLPQFEDAVSLIAQAHEQGRGVAIHCVSEVELVYTLAALEQAGVQAGDRIEHASVTPPAQLDQIASMGLAICSQPHFLTERGDQYVTDVEPRLIGDLYRLKSFINAGLPLVGGSDAPFGSVDPWSAMRAAVSRTTTGGQTIAPDEALSPEEAVALYLSCPQNLVQKRTVSVGVPADLCLLDHSWAKARTRLLADDVAATLISGQIVYNRVNQAPL